jgi:hypothetical protein
MGAGWAICAADAVKENPAAAIAAMTTRRMVMNVLPFFCQRSVNHFGTAIHKR